MIKNVILLVVYFLLFITTNAEAYIPVGSITVLLQIGIAAIVGSIFIFRDNVIKIFYKLFELIKPNKSKDK